MKSKARKEIDKWMKANWSDRMPSYLGTGYVFMFPSKSNDDTHHLVVRLERKTQRKVYVDYACDCKGFFHSPVDECWHVKTLKNQYGEEAVS